MATTRQQLAFDYLVGNGGNITQAMLKAGYSPNTANTPQKLTESEGWKELLEKHLPDSLITQKHKELLDQKRIDYFLFPKKMSDEDIVAHVASVGITVITVREGEKGKMAFYATADAMAIKNAVDMAYKLRGSYAPDKHVSLNLNGEIIPNEELEALANQLNAITRNNSGKGIRGNGAIADVVGSETQDQELGGTADGVHKPQIHVGPDERHESAPSVAEAPADRSE